MHTEHLRCTRFGKVTLVPTQGDHIYVTTNPAGGRQDRITPWVINGKSYKFITAHVHLWSDGVWRIGEEKNTGGEGLYFTEGTESAKKQARKEIESEVNHFAKANPDILKEADQTYLDNLIARRETELEELNVKIKALTADRDALVAKLKGLDG